MGLVTAMQEELTVEEDAPIEAAEAFEEEGSLEAADMDRYARYALMALFGLFIWPVLVMLVLVYENEPDFAHGYLVPVIIGYTAHLIWAERSKIPMRTGWLGLLPFAVGIVFI